MVAQMPPFSSSSEIGFISKISFDHLTNVGDERFSIVGRVSSTLLTYPYDSCFYTRGPLNIVKSILLSLSPHPAIG